MNLPMPEPLPDFYNDLARFEAEGWRLLKAGVKDRHSPLHVLAVATLAADGFPDARMMVLRDAGQCHLRFHTDLRSPKAAAIGDGAPVTVLGYHPEARMQLRMRGTARIETRSDAAELAWREATLYARRCYLGPDGPGVPSGMPSSGLPAHLEGREPQDYETVPGRYHFAIVTVSVQSLDLLYLLHVGHRRAVFHYGTETCDPGWRVP